MKYTKINTKKYTKWSLVLSNFRALLGKAFFLGELDWSPGKPPALFDLVACVFEKKIKLACFYNTPF